MSRDGALARECPPVPKCTRLVRTRRDSNFVGAANTIGHLQGFYTSPLTDSNRRPPPYHGGALPTELRGRGPDCSPGRGARCDGLRGCLRGRGRLAGWRELARVVAREHLLADSERVPRDLERPRADQAVEVRELLYRSWRAEIARNDDGERPLPVRQ